MDDLISIIVPAYNAERYIKKCVRSIIGQTYSNIEIILVNDCSTDGTLDVIRSLEKKDKRIRIVDKTVNEGEDLARHTGIKNATGDFLCFVDADDWLNPTYLMNLHHKIKAHNVDIVVGGCIRWFSERLRVKRTAFFNSDYINRVIDGKDKNDLFISYFGCNIFPVTMWGGLFRHDLFSKDLFQSKLKFGADLIMSIQLFQRAKSVYMTNYAGYNYRWGGVTAGYNPQLWECAKFQLYYKLDILDQIDFPEAEHYQAIEVKNYIWTVITSLLFYKIKSKDELTEWLSNEFKEPLFSRAFSCLSNEYILSQSGYSKAIFELDVSKTVENALDYVKQNRLRFQLKQLSGKIIKCLNL